VAIEILGPIALILGVLPSWTAAMLIAFVIAASGTSHRYWEFAEAAARRNQEINFFKNVGVVAGLLFYSMSGAGGWSLSAWMAGKPAAQEPKAPQAPQSPQAPQTA
jgi:putative oxidoreductase